MSGKAIEKRKERILKLLRDVKNPSKRSLEYIYAKIGNNDDYSLNKFSEDTPIMFNAIESLISEGLIIRSKGKLSSDCDKYSTWLEYNKYPSSLIKDQANVREEEYLQVHLG